MKYRTKLYLFLLFMSLVSTTMMMWIVYSSTRSTLLQQIKSQVVSIAGTTAALLDKETFETWINHPEETSPTFLNLKNTLLKVVKANQRQDIFVRYVYIIKPSPKYPNHFIYLIDSETDPDELNPYGEIEPTSPSLGLLDHLNTPFTPIDVVTDNYGTWFSGYAPIQDEKGSYVATVGVDLDATDVFNTMSTLLKYEMIACALSVLFALIAAYILSRKATKALNIVCTTVNEIGKGNLSKRVVLKNKDEFYTLAESINTMAKGLEERERMQKNFASYVSSHVLEKILTSETALELGGERREITMLFSDIRKFTTLSEEHPPEIVVALLNEYFEKMIGIIFKYHGTLDKFLGDGLMVEFGAPLDDPEAEYQAVKAALEMQSELKTLCEKWHQEGKPPIRIGIGIHTGIAIVGTIGSTQRMEYTAIGDTVNVASRIQAATKTFDVEILVSETTYERVKDRFIFDNLGPITLTGRTAPLTVYNVLGEKNETITDNT